MITLTTPFVPEFTPYLPPAYTNKRALYFDIETTGLSAQSSYVYLIGCATVENGSYTLTQWMCTEPSEEKELLRLFFSKAKDYDLLLHYNGTGFDLPFLEKKAKRHCLDYPLRHLESLDLYAAARKMKAYLPTEDLKLKSMEQFFSFSRTDTFSGGELIEVYAQFLGLYRLNELTNHSKEREVTALGHVLLLHNAEDVKNLPSLTLLLFLQNLSKELIKGQMLATPCLPIAADSRLQDVLGNATLTLSALSMEYAFSFTLPASFELSLPFDGLNIKLTLNTDGVVSVVLPVYSGELKYFYLNPADYYYLPAEDCAMHKSVASFVEKKFRKKATAATCYTRQTGLFLPFYFLGTKKEAPKSMSFPCFLSDYKSAYGYTPYTEKLNTNLITELICFVLDSFL